MGLLRLFCAVALMELTQRQYRGRAGSTPLGTVTLWQIVCTIDGEFRLLPTVSANPFASGRRHRASTLGTYLSAISSYPRQWQPIYYWSKGSLGFSIVAFDDSDLWRSRNCARQSMIERAPRLAGFASFRHACRGPICRYEAE